MDQQIINWFLGGFGVLIGFTLKSVWEALKDLQIADRALVEKVAAIEVLVAGMYVRKDEFNISMQTLFSKLDKIEDKIDRKVDKS